MNTTKRLPLFLVGFLLLLGGGYLFFHTIFPSEKTFTVQEETDFYVLGFGSIHGFQLQEDQPKKISQDYVEIVKGDINFFVQRAEIANRYLLFSEEGPPHGVVGRIIGLDFQEGLIRYHKTPRYADTSSGVSAHYYFTSDDDLLTAFDPRLHEVSQYEFKIPMLVGDFAVDADRLYCLAIPIHDDYHHAELYTFSTTDGQIRLEETEVFLPDSEKTYQLIDTLVKGDYLYATMSGYRIHATKEAVFTGQLVRYDIAQKTKEFFDLEEVAPTNFFDIGEDMVAIEHEPNVDHQLGFSLFDFQSQQTRFVDLTRFGLSLDTAYLKDVKRLDEDTLLVLAGDSLVGYSIQQDSLLFHEPHIAENAFHIWVNHPR